MGDFTRRFEGRMSRDSLDGHKFVKLILAVKMHFPSSLTMPHYPQIKQITQIVYLRNLRTDNLVLWQGGHLTELDWIRSP